MAATVTPLLFVTTIPKKASATPILFATTTPKKVSATPVLFVTTTPFSSNVTLDFDTSRNVTLTETIAADTLREVTDGVSTVIIDADTKRNVVAEETISADTAREIKSFTNLSYSTVRYVVNASKQQISIGNNVLTLAPKTQVDSISAFDSVINFDFNGGINLAGEYHIPVSHQIQNANNDVASVDIGIDAEAYNINQWLDMAADVDSIKDFDGTSISSFVRVIPYMRTSTDGENFGDWKQIVSGAQYRGLVFDFKIALLTTDSNTTVLVRNFSYTVRK